MILQPFKQVSSLSAQLVTVIALSSVLVVGCDEQRATVRPASNATVTAAHEPPIAAVPVGHRRRVPVGISATLADTSAQLTLTAHEAMDGLRVTLSGSRGLVVKQHARTFQADHLAKGGELTIPVAYGSRSGSGVLIATVSASAFGIERGDVWTFTLGDPAAIVRQVPKPFATPRRAPIGAPPVRAPATVAH